MKNKNHTTLPVLIIFSLFASLIGIGATSPSSETEINNSTCCKQESNGCPGKKESESRGDVLLDNFSRQFISVFSFGL